MPDLFDALLDEAGDYLEKQRDDYGLFLIKAGLLRPSSLLSPGDLMRRAWDYVKQHGRPTDAAVLEATEGL